jgi:thiol-disulfide isomerase/thioredoxin
MTAACALLLLFAADDAKPAEQLKRLTAESAAIEKTFHEELRADRTNEGVIKANQKYRDACQAWVEKALAAVRKAPDLPEAFDVIAGILGKSGMEVPEMVGLLRKHHGARKDLGKLFLGLVQSDAQAGPDFIREMAEKSPVEAVRGQAAYFIGWQAKWRIMRDGEERFGFGRKLTEEQRVELEEKATKYLTLASRYDDAPMASWGGKVGPTARGELIGLKNLSALRVGRAAPDIEGEAVDGSKLKLSEHRGKVTVVVFWASWCGPCMRMVPHEKKLVERMRGKPFVLVGVNGDDDKEKAKEAARKHGMSWPSFWDAAERRDGPITKAWNVHAWPTIYVLDADGVIRYTGHSDAKLDELVDEFVAKAKK